MKILNKYPRCTTSGKIRYPGKSVAKKASRKMGGRMRLYVCKYCGDVHRTSGNWYRKEVEGFQ